MKDNTDYETASGLGLSDIAFRSLHVTNLASTLYIVGWLGLGLAAVIIFCLGLYLLFAVGGWFALLGIVLLGAAPIVFLVGLMIIRILLEAAVVLLRIEANTRQ